MRCLVLVAAVAGCGGPSATPASRARPPAAALKPCPQGAELATLAATAWAVSGPAEDVWCVPLRIDRVPRWFIAGSAKHEGEEGPTEAHWRSLVSADDRRAIWKQREETGDYAHAFDHASAHDLDADGDDEVVFELQYGEGGASATMLVVIGFENDRPVTDSVPLGHQSGADEEGCTGAWKVVPSGRARHIEVTRSGACEAQTEVVRWTGRRFAAAGE